MSILPLTVHETTPLRPGRCIHRGKVRDVYAIDADSLLIVATDRLSAFDVVLPDPIPGKGSVLNRDLELLVRHARRTSCPNHLLTRPLERRRAAIRPSARRS